MPDLDFNTTAGQTIDRELLIAYGNYGTAAAPQWGPLGSRVTNSSIEYDWSDESSQDILGVTHSSMKKPIMTQSFDPAPLDAGDEYQKKIWNLAVKEQNAAALCAQDLLIVHYYAGFAERYESCMVKPTSLGGEGGGSVNMPYEVTYGGTRTVGTATKAADGTVTFTPETSAD